MTPPTTITASDGKSYKLSETTATALTAGDHVTVNVAGVPAVASVNLFDITGPTLKTIGGGVKLPYAWVVPDGIKVLEVQVRAHAADYAIGKFRLAVSPPATPPTPPIVTTPPASQPDDTSAPVPPVVSGPVAKPAFGACVDGYAMTQNDCALAKKLYALGVRRFRWFGSGAQHGNVKYTGNDAHYAALIYAACPDAVCTIHFGVSEQQTDDKGNVTRYATPWTTAEKHAFWAGVVAAFTADKRSRWEIENESNSPHYLYFGQDESKFDTRVCAYDVETIWIVRLHAGPTRQLVMSTVGLNYTADLHVATVNAHHYAGVYNDPNVICGVHSYPDGGAVQLRAQLGGIRGIIGPVVPIEITEGGVHNLRSAAGTNLVPVADVPAAAAQYLAIAAEFNAEWDWFRGHVADPSKWYHDRCLLNFDGTRNAPLCDALPLAVLA